MEPYVLIIFHLFCCLYLSMQPPFHFHFLILSPLVFWTLWQRCFSIVHVCFLFYCQAYYLSLSCNEFHIKLCNLLFKLFWVCYTFSFIMWIRTVFIPTLLVHREELAALRVTNNDSIFIKVHVCSNWFDYVCKYLPFWFTHCTG